MTRYNEGAAIVAVPVDPTAEMILAGEKAGWQYLADAKDDAKIRDVRPVLTAEIYRAMVLCGHTGKGRWCPEGEILLPQSREEAAMMNVISERFLYPERFK